MLSKLDKEIIGLISQDLPLVNRPFKTVADKLGISEDRLLSQIRLYKKNGFMRKYSAVLNHREIGFKFNAMAVWNIPERSVKAVGIRIASFPQVSHCYQRRKASSWRYNLYAMIHGKTKLECIVTVRKICNTIGFSDCKVLFSSKEYKKTGVKY